MTFVRIPRLLGETVTDSYGRLVDGYVADGYCERAEATRFAADLRAKEESFLGQGGDLMKFLELLREAANEALLGRENNPSFSFFLSVNAILDAKLKEYLKR